MAASKTLEDAINGNSTAAAGVWRAIAEGKASDAQALEWVRLIAARVVDGVLDAEFDASNRRADAALKAIGFYGRIDKNESLRALLLDLERLRSRGISRTESVEILRLLTYALDGMPTEKLVKKFDRLREK